MIIKSDIKRGFLLLSSMFHAKHVGFNAFFLLWLRFPLPDCVFTRQRISLPFKLWEVTKEVAFRAKIVKAYSVKLKSNPYI